jgi:hypothetical protein
MDIAVLPIGVKTLQLAADRSFIEHLSAQQFLVFRKPGG